MKSIRAQMAVVMALFGIILTGSIVAMSFFTNSYDRIQTTQMIRQAVINRYDALIQSQVQSVASTLQALYNENAADPQKAIQLCKDVLKEIRYNADRSGYFWADDFSGVNQVHATSPATVGTHRLEAVDKHGTTYMKDIIYQGLLQRLNLGATESFRAQTEAVATQARAYLQAKKRSADGFSEYYFTKASDLVTAYPKRAYSLALEGLNWVIGTGNYIDDIDAEVAKYDQTIEKNENIALGSILQFIVPLIFLLMFSMYVYVFQLLNGITDISRALKQITPENIGSIRSLPVKGRDEIAQAKQNYNGFVATMKNLEEASRVLRERGSAAVAGVEAKIADSLKAQQSQLATLNSVIEDASERDKEALLKDLDNLAKGIRAAGLEEQNILEAMKDVRAIVRS